MTLSYNSCHDEVSVANMSVVVVVVIVAAVVVAVFTSVTFSMEVSFKHLVYQAVTLINCSILQVGHE